MSSVLSAVSAPMRVKVSSFRVYAWLACAQTSQRSFPSAISAAFIGMFRFVVCSDWLVGKLCSCRYLLLPLSERNGVFF